MSQNNKEHRIHNRENSSKQQTKQFREFLLGLLMMG
jgi:hypothetical protein